MSDPFTKEPSLLIVDDTPENIQLLAGMLKNMGYKVRPTMSGRQALQAAKCAPPDLILLDIIMPDMGGYEVCEELKKDELLRDIPIIFISAVHETLDKVKAFQMGAVDYITKPFQLEEVEARVRTHLQLRRNAQALEASNAQLRETQKMRDDLVHMLVHDLRTPIWSINVFLDMLAKSEPTLSEGGVEMLEQMAASSASILEMVASILDVGKMEAGAMLLNPSTFDLVEVIRNLIKKLKPIAGAREVHLEDPPPDTDCELTADKGLITRVVENLLANAIKFSRETGTRIVMQVEPMPDTIRFTIRDNGFGIPDDVRDTVFDKFTQASSHKKYSTGLGLPFCKLAVEAHGGTIQLGDSDGTGTVFHVELPRTVSPKPQEET